MISEGLIQFLFLKGVWVSWRGYSTVSLSRKEKEHEVDGICVPIL